jgi:hypothetical protein
MRGAGVEHDGAYGYLAGSGKHSGGGDEAASRSTSPDVTHVALARPKRRGPLWSSTARRVDGRLPGDALKLRP